MKKQFFYLIAACLFSACEKEIEIDLNSSNAQFVIEGNITNDPGPYEVTISKTVDFSDGNTFPAVTGALVIIEENGLPDTLVETSPGRYFTNTTTGIPGHTYVLKVSVEGKQFVAQSTMPSLVNLDSLRFSLFTSPAGESYMTIPVFTDPSVLGNYYRFIQTVNGEADISYILANDAINNGTVNQRPILSPTFDIQPGDSVHIEMRCVDYNTYLYFNTLSQIVGAGPNGGATPSNPPNNFSGENALGYFSAHTTQHKTTVVP